MMKDLSISKLVENLTRTDSESQPPDPLGLRTRLEAALTAIAAVEKGGDLPGLLHQFIGEGIYIGHLPALSSYDYDNYLGGSTRLLISLGQLNRFTSEHRLKVSMVGLVKDSVLLPMTFHTAQEADRYIKTFDDTLRRVPVELSSALVDSQAQPEAPETVSEPPPGDPAPRQVEMIDEKSKLVPPQEDQT